LPPPALAFEGHRGDLAHNHSYTLARATLYALTNVCAVRMAGVFVSVVSTVGARTAIMPRWSRDVGFACAIGLLVIFTNAPWRALLFLFRILVLSGSMLVTAPRQPKGAVLSEGIGVP
jgi:hypothetical protein